jgi:hypothetical protein
MKLSYYKFRMEGWLDLFTFIGTVRFGLYDLSVKTFVTPGDHGPLPAAEIQVLMGIDSEYLDAEDLKANMVGVGSELGENTLEAVPNPYEGGGRAAA